MSGPAGQESSIGPTRSSAKPNAHEREEREIHPKSTRGGERRDGEPLQAYGHSSGVTTEPCRGP
jgi:hypothetical protein